MIKPFWKVSGKQTYGEFDRDAVLKFTFDATEFLAAAGTDLTLDEDATTILLDDKLSATMLVESPLITAVVRLDSQVPSSVGDWIPFTVRTVASDGQQDDKTFHLLLVEA